MKRQRGAALLYVLAMVGATSVLVAANLDLTTSSRRVAGRTESAVQSKYATLAASEIFAARGTATPDQALTSFQFTLAGQPVRVSASAAAKRVASLTVYEASRTSTITVADPRGYSPFLYALYVQRDAKSAGVLEVTGTTTPGHAYFGGNLDQGSSSGNDIVSGAVDTANQFTTSNIGTVSGPLTAGLISDPLPSLPIFLNPYEVNVGPTSVTDGGPTGGNVRVIIATGDITVTGTFSGNYILATSANIRLKSPISVRSGAHLVMMCGGNADVLAAGGGGANLAGFLYCRGKFSTGGNDVTWKGGIVTRDFENKQLMTINYDDFFWDDPKHVSAKVSVKCEGSVRARR
ncbi:MAG: hypothetical protein C4320_03555 [Armatimonadota bacterium]